MNQFAFFSIPLDMLEEAGISMEDIVQISAGKGKVIIEPADGFSDFVCIHDCENCPISEIDCSGECESCPCSEECEESEEQSNE